MSSYITHEEKDFLHDLQKFFDKIDGLIAKQNTRTILIGITGAGKSTIFNLMLHELEYCYIGKNEYDKVTFKRTDGQDFISFVHAGLLSETKFPTSQGDFTDCPGFEDTNSVTQSIINAYSIDRLLRETAKIKIVLVSSWSELDAIRSLPFVNVLKRLGDIFAKHIDKIQNSLCLVTTRIESQRGDTPFTSEENIGRIRAKLEALDGDLKDNKENENAKKILKVLIDSKRHNVAPFTVPKIRHTYTQVCPLEKSAIKQMFDNLKYIDNISPILSIDEKGYQKLERCYSNSLSKTLDSVHELYEKRHAFVKEIIDNSTESKESAGSFRKRFDTFGKTITIGDPEDYQNFIEYLMIFYHKCQAVFSDLRTESIKNSLHIFEFVKKLGITLKATSGDMEKECAKQILRTINGIADYFCSIGGRKLENIDQKLILSGYVVGTSDLPSQNSDYNDIDIISLHSLLLDKDVTASGANLTILSPYWFKKTTVRICLSGKDGDQETGIDQKTGEGLPGNPGFPGGNFYGSFSSVIGESDLEIISNGGKGSNGTDGLNGAEGTNGAPVDPPEFMSKRKKKYTFNVEKIKKFKFANRGTPGSKGYSGGAKGLGGQRGQITLSNFPGVLKTHMDGDNGIEGAPGKGGLGGLYPDLRETFEEHDEIAFGKIKSVPLRRVAQFGAGVITIGILPAVTGFSAILNTRKTPDTNDYSKTNARAPRGEMGVNSQAPKPIATKAAINIQEKQLKYREYAQNKGVRLTFS